MAHRQKTAKRPKPRTVLRLPDLEQSKNAVLNSLPAASSQESYGHAIDEFIGWYCSEPRLAFSRTVVLRYRFFLEQNNLAPSTINVRLAAVRRLACRLLPSLTVLDSSGPRDVLVPRIPGPRAPRSCTSDVRHFFRRPVNHRVAKFVRVPRLVFANRSLTLLERF